MYPSDPIQAIRSSDRALICARLQLATTWRGRLRGLLGRDRLAKDEGLWLSPCSSIHTVGMRVSIDVIFLDKHGVVRRIAHRVKPYSFRVGPRGSRNTLELAAGVAARVKLQKGDSIVLQHRPVEICYGR